MRNLGLTEQIFTYFRGVKPKDENKIEQIFKAMLQLVKQKGVAGITMSEIARAANIATGTLYIYFSSKEALINELFTRCRKNAIDIYFKDYSESLPFVDGFKVVWHNLLLFRIEHFEESVFMDQCHHSPFITESTKEIANKMIQPLYKLVERGKEERILKETDSVIQLAFIVGSINQFARHCIYGDKIITNELKEQLFNLCWDGLKVVVSG